MSPIDKIGNPFIPVTGINPVGVGGAGKTGGGTGPQGPGPSPFESDMADFRSNLPKNNGTGDLIPKNNSSFDVFG